MAGQKQEFPDEVREIEEAYPALFELTEQVESLMGRVMEEFNAHQIKLFDLPAYRRIFLFIFTRSMKSFSSIALLCRNGYGQDVAVLLRSLFEQLITVRYILFDKNTANEKVARFVAYKWVIFKRQLPEQEKAIDPNIPEQGVEFEEKKARILKECDAFKERFGLKSDRALITWSGKTVRDMAGAVNPSLAQDYENIFRLCSRFSHPSILGDREYLVQEDHTLMFSPWPSAIGIVTNLRYAIVFMMDFLRIITREFDFPFTSEIDALERKIYLLDRDPHYREDPVGTSSGSQKSSIRESKVAFRLSPR